MHKNTHQALYYYSKTQHYYIYIADYKCYTFTHVVKHIFTLISTKKNVVLLNL